jgi:hypothetical protein
LNGKALAAMSRDEMMTTMRVELEKAIGQAEKLRGL